VPDTEPNPQVTFTGRDNFASYAAVRSSDGALTVMVINKVLSGNTPVTINLSNFSAASSAQAWQLTSAGAITQLANVTVATGSLTATVPAQSITLFVIPAMQSSSQTLSQWETFYGITSLTATPKGDGIPNLLKYFYDINPNQTMTAADRAALPVFTLDTTTTPDTTNLKLVYRQYAHLSGVTLNVQMSLDLKTWTTLTSNQYTSQQTGTSVGDSGTTDPVMEIEVPATTAKAFLRLNITSP
jgi:hypothetical protein